MSLSAHQFELIFGVIGNIISIMVFFSPVPTFWTIYKKKTSEGYQSIPYAVALMSAMLLLYYAVLKTNAYLLITINSFGCVIEVFYIVLYIFYAPKKEKISTLKVLTIFNFGVMGVIIGGTMIFLHGNMRTRVVGLICATFTLAVFISPLSIMKKVITTKSVEYMPFFLSFSLLLNATVWFFYGFFIKDPFIAVPNIVGFILGMIQIILYMIYRDGKEKSLDEKLEDGNKNEREIKDIKMTEPNYNNA